MPNAFIELSALALFMAGFYVVAAVLTGSWS
jgi:hypothetical protein